MIITEKVSWYLFCCYFNLTFTLSPDRVTCPDQTILVYENREINFFSLNFFEVGFFSHLSWSLLPFLCCNYINFVTILCLHRGFWFLAKIMYTNFMRYRTHFSWELHLLFLSFRLLQTLLLLFSHLSFSVCVWSHWRRANAEGTWSGMYHTGDSNFNRLSISYCRWSDRDATNWWRGRGVAFFS